MEKIRRALALTVSVIAAAAMASCGSTDGGDTNGTTTSVTTVKKVEVEDTEEIEEIAEDVQKDIIWMGTYDLNPNEAKGEDKSVEMTLFNNKGGNVIWSQVSDSEKFDKLGAAMLTSECPDIFKYEWMAFPAQVIKDMYQPVDSIVDFSDPLWADVKVNADQFVMDGKHYVAPISFSVGTVMMYDHNVVEANGLDDPYKEYLDGNWNWDTWSDMMTDFCESSPDGVQRYGINGWFQPHIIQQTGKTMVNYVDGQFVSNLMDPDIERAENLLYDLGKKGYVNTDWLGNARNALKDGNILFYCMGTWAMTGNNGPEEGDDYRIVPVPSDPNNDEKVMTADMTAYMWVRGSTASDAVKTWYECCRIANTDEQYKENGREKFMNANPAWTDEMYDVFVQASSSENRMIFDYGYGISSEMSDDNASMDGNCITRKLYEFTNKTDDAGAQYTWTSLRETYSATVDQELKTINEAVAAYTSK
ncbi:MAG: extracellular solute-binding protein [Ruminococcus sp.]|nr:extracellular solute-binding protein [Ruminococcus sp.]